MKRNKLSLWRDTRGLTTVEYIILLSLVAVVGYAIWRQFGQTIKGAVINADTQLGTMDDDVSSTEL